MIDGLTALITQQGWLAPLWYVGGFLLAALVPVIPTPLIAALGGTAFGSLPAILYGLVGLGLGAAAALNLARRLGLPLIRRLVPARTWSEWEVLLGIRSPWMWGVIFLVLNMDVAVMAAGLSSLPMRQLWIAALLARLPWLVGSAILGELLLVNDAALVLIMIVIVPILWGLAKLRPALRRILARWVEASEPVSAGTSTSTTTAAPGRAGSGGGVGPGGPGGPVA